MGTGRNTNYARGAATSSARGRGRGRGNYHTEGAGGRGNHQPTAEPLWVNRSPNQANSGNNQQPWGHRPPQLQTPQQGLGPLGGRVDAWTGRSWGQPRTPSSRYVQPKHQPQPQPRPRSSSGVDRFAFYVFLLLISLLCELFGCNYLVKPNKIVVFRDGVSEWQIERVLAEKLRDLKNATRLVFSLKIEMMWGPLAMCLQELWWIPKLFIRSILTFIFAATVEVLVQASLLTAMCCTMRILLLLMSCRNSYMICASLLLDAQSPCRLCRLWPMLISLPIEGVCFKELQWSTHLPLTHLPPTEQPQLQHLLLYLTSVSTICTQTWRTSCFLFECPAITTGLVNIP